MSRSLLARSVSSFLVVLLSATACSESSITSATGAMTVASPRDAAVAQTTAPASAGWQEQARTLVGSANMSALAASRVYAAVGIAQYRALLALPNHDDDGAVPDNGIGEGGRSMIELRRGAVAGASASVLSFLFQAAAANLESRVQSEGAAGQGQTHPQFERGLTIGRTAGAAMVEHLKTDRFTTPWTGTVPSGDGMWRANGTPAGATFGNVKTYFLTSGAQFRPAAPPAWQSTAFMADLGEIVAMAADRTDAQRALALQWNYAGGTPTPPGYWSKVAAEYIAERGLDELAAARTFAITNGAMMDALVACWEAKYHYWTIRPSQVTPIALVYALPNHPSYPSGHSCVSSAAATVLSAFFPEHTAQLQANVTDAGLSRMYAGIHYRFDISAGNQLGAAVANWAMANAHLIEQD